MPGLMFHHFHGLGAPRVQGSLSAGQLHAIIEQRRPCNAAEFLHDPSRTVLTFDDGLISQWIVAAPILRFYGLTAFFFVYTAPLVGIVSRLEYYRAYRTSFPDIDSFYDLLNLRPAPGGYLDAHTYLSSRDRDFRYWRDQVCTPGEYEETMDQVMATNPRAVHTDLWMTVGMLTALQQEGHIIGMHSHSHPTVMAHLTREQQEIEYATASYILMHHLGRWPTAMSHPCNSYTPHGLSYLKTLNYTLGFRATPEPGYWGPLEVPRIDSADLVKQL